MIAVANRIFVNPEYADQFEERFRHRAGLVDKQAGFEENMVLRPTTEGEPYVVLSFWDSREQFEAWTKSDAFTKGHAQSGTLPKDVFTAPSKLEIHEVFLDTREDR